ncbi:MAG: serine/threonine protein kinase [Gemmataceae bacterium]|nr:serine/threonine protein kinase [Gemmataceae bacterium]
MPSPASSEEFLELVRKAEVADDRLLDTSLERINAPEPPKTLRELADKLIEAGILTKHQSSLLLKGSWNQFRIGPYRILERLGFGATSNVYLCKHQASNERVAVKVLAAMQAKDPKALKRFFREAKAAAPLDHPNLVRVRDADWDGETNFIVMDFVDGSSIQDIVQQFGPMDIYRAAFYMRQAAQGLQYAHEAGLVHRDIKPGNLLIDRTGKVKILDMGLARFADEEGIEALTQGEVLGSPEYLAPEQARDSHNVDIRADIYALGAVFYFMLTGKAPYFEEKSAAGRLLSKAKRPPKPIQSLRSEVPDALVAVVDTMMAKDPAERYQDPQEVASALKEWGMGPLDPPPEKEMPQLSPAAMRDSDKPAPSVQSVKKGKAKAKRAAEASRSARAEEPEARELSATTQAVVIIFLALATFGVAWAIFNR